MLPFADFLMYTNWMSNTPPDNPENTVAAFAKIIAKNLVRARHARRLSQRDLAEMIGMGRSSYNHIELGKRRLKLDESVLLCRILEVPVDYLLYGGNNQSTKLLSQAADLRARASLLEKRANACSSEEDVDTAA